MSEVNSSASMASSITPATRALIMASVMLAVTMSVIDSTIANVALPHMQGSLSAGQDQITWVLTSYIIAQTLMTPLLSWIAGRVGRKNLLLASVAGFTAASIACGLAGNLVEMVGFRLIQGFCCASFIPMAQATMFDINEPKDHPKAMAVFGAGIMVGPVLGPIIGGWITDTLNWRWCFLINLPVGILAFTGLWISLPKRKRREMPPFDFTGFAFLAIFLASLQLILDRGPGQDWFGSREIWLYLGTALIGLYLFTVQTITSKSPFFSPALLSNRNFLLGCTIGFLFGALLYSASALIPTLLQNVMHLPAYNAGLVLAPRGIGMMITMTLTGRIAGRISDTVLIGAGFIVNAVTMYFMAHLSLDMDTAPIIILGVIAGLGSGLIFVSMTTITFSTVAAEFRTEAATIYTLVRSLGMAIGISVMQALLVQNVQIVHASLAEHASVDNPLIGGMSGFDLSSVTGRIAFDAELYRQATMIAYLNDFKLSIFLSLLTMPILFLIHSQKRASKERPDVVFE